MMKMNALAPRTALDDGPQPSMAAAELPPGGTKRWVPRRKAMVVDAVRAGAISLEEACRRFALSRDEFNSWRKAMELHGVPGLRTTRLQIYGAARRRASLSAPRETLLRQSFG